MLQGPQSMLYANDGTTLIASASTAVAGTETAVVVRSIPSTTLGQLVVGAASNNTAVPGAALLGALTAVATTAAPTYTNGNLVALSTDLAGNMRVSLTGTNVVTGSGTAGTPATGVLTVQGIASGTPLFVTLSGTNAVVGTLTHNNAAPAATNIGVLGAIATAGAPTYTTGNQVALSTDLAGNLRVVGTFAAGALTDTTATGTLNGGSTFATIAMGGFSGASWSIPASTTLIGTLTPQVSFDGGTNWVNTYFIVPATSGQSLVPTITVASGVPNGSGILVPGGSSNVRIQVTAYTSGTTTGTIRATVVGNEDLGPAVGWTGTAAPLHTLLVGGTDGTNLQNLRVQANNTAAASGLLALIGRYDAALPTLTSGNVAAPQLDINGRQLVVGAGTAGTPAGGVVSIQGVASGTALTVNNTTPANLQVQATGTLTNNNAAPAATHVGALTALANAAAPTYTEGNEVLLSVDLGGALRMQGKGVAGTPAGGVLTIQGIGGGTAIPVSGTFAGGLTNNSAVPGANNMGVLPAVVVNTPAAWSVGNQALLTVDTAGRLQVAGSGTPGSPAGGVVTVQGPNGAGLLDVNVVNGGAVSGTGNVIQVAYTTTNSSACLAANANRRGTVIYNDANRVMYIALAATCTPTSFTTKLVASGGYYEVPAGYNGVITCVWAAGGTGFAYVTALSN